jgi:hypothetical protein
MKDVTVGLISEGFNIISYDMKYSGIHSAALFDYLYSQLKIIKPTRCITGAKPGADTIWAKVCIALNIPLTCVLPCQDYGIQFDDNARTEINAIKRYSSVNIIGSAGWSLKKEDVKNQGIVNRSDILFFVVNDKKQISNPLAYADGLDKEIILIDLNDLP